MRVLVVAEDAEERAARARDLDGAGHEVCGACEAPQVTALVRATRPEALVVASTASTGALRLLLGRARGAAERVLPAVLLLDPSSLWLRAALPDDLGPAVALSTLEADGARIAAALASLAGEARGRGAAADTRHLAGPGGEAWLTPSESEVLAALLRQPGTFITSDDLARALWGQATVDRYQRGAVRTHVHTLRRKLTAVGFQDAVESLRGVGYRLTEAFRV